MTEKTTSQERPPIVVVMGHVDHGKSTLLDYIRKSDVVAGEAGGITQHVAAYEVEHMHEGKNKRVTFIDTPGHAAFSAIRARGANVADVAILVVAADDGVKAQTLEALESIKASEVPFVVAINKIDKPNADIEKTKYSLLEHGVYLEGLGGDVSFAPISAKSGEGVDALLDLVLLTAELEELKGDTGKAAEGFTIEAARDAKRGIAATLIITDGTMQTGSFVQAGGAVAPLRLMEDHRGSALKKASFSTPVRVFGFDVMPQVGSPFTVFENRADAEAAAAEAARLEAAVAAAAPHEGAHVVPLIIKADAGGSLEAILSEIAKLGNEEVCFRVVSTGLGSVTEGDVKVALATPEDSALVVAFTVPTDRNATELARQNNIAIESFTIIYKLTERLEEVLKERKPVKTVQEVLGQARILKVFSSKHDEHLVGGKVESGLLSKNLKARLVRKDTVMCPAEVLTIQAARQAVEKAELGSEFGALIACAEEPQGGDILEVYTEAQG